MARGFVAGTTAGLLVAGVALVVLSLVDSRVSASKPEPAPAAIAPNEAPAPIAGTEPEVPALAADAENPPADTPAPDPVAATPQTPDLAQASPTPDDSPQTATAVTQPEAEAVGAQAPTPPADGTAVPSTAAAEADASVAGSGVNAPTVPGTEAQPAPTPGPTSPSVTSEAVTAPPPGEESASGVAAAQDPAIQEDVPGLADGGADPEQAPDTGSPPAPKPPIKSAPVTAIGDLAPGVSTGRLPRIGDAPAEASETPETSGEPDDGVATGPAISRNAAAFDAPANRPLMAVMLIDTGADRVQLGDLANLPFATSFIVDASAADADDAIAFYRAAGAEVVLSIPIPQGAQPADIEVNYLAHAEKVDQAVAVMAPKEAGFQTAGDLARQVAAIAAADGHGLISFPQGLNTGHKSALKANVPAGLVFRELDNDGQSAQVIRRFMDNAAFKARQTNGVIMLGHARPETLQALIEWSLGNRAKSVALAPVSAVLLDK